MTESRDPRSIRIDYYDYPLEDSRIARHPLADREECRLLVADDYGNISHCRFYELPGLLPEGTELFCNDTRVINARIEMFKSTGSRIEIFLLEPLAPSDYGLMFQSSNECRWACLVGNRKRWKEGALEKRINTPGGPALLSATLGPELPGNAFEITFSWDNRHLTWSDVVNAAGAIPIPPYLKRESEESDYSDYQTVYASTLGSVAAPTAGLHFTDALLQKLNERGVKRHAVTLHVGAGTFKPVKSEEIGDHPMHTEVFTVSLDTIEALVKMLDEHRPVTAVGTTTVRTLESLPYLARRLRTGRPPIVTQWEAYEEPPVDALYELKWMLKDMKASGADSISAATSIMIAPGFRWNIVRAMITNFHQPQSTLLLLVSSFLGDRPGSDSPRLWRRYYDEALAHDYRFLSYGDACLFIVKDNPQSS